MLVDRELPDLGAELSPTGADQLWVADLTYIRPAIRFVYLAVKHEEVFDFDSLLYFTILESGRRDGPHGAHHLHSIFNAGKAL